MTQILPRFVQADVAEMSGALVDSRDVSPSGRPGLPYPHLRDKPIRFPAEVMEPGEDFDKAGFELPPPPQVAPAESGQGELFSDDNSQPNSADGEPVFWSASGGQDFPTDDCVHADAAESI